MPPKKIKLHVSANNASNGVLNVKVTPWRVHLDPGDIVHWELDVTGPANNDIQWFRIEQIDQLRPWPFDAPEPPDPLYTALATGSGSGTVISPPINNHNGAGAVISYGLTIGFIDDNRRKRTMYIDPDMIIDS